MTERVDTLVIGAGVVGLAIARELAERGREVIVLEAAEAIGTATSSRNSEVIHAGIYYPTASLKARLCVSGRDMLYDYCARRGVEHRCTGKILVATSPQECATLDRYREQARVNGAGELEPLTTAQVHDLEPAVECVAGLYSPRTGIVDSHGLMLALEGDLENAGGQVALLAPVIAGEVTSAGIRIEVGGEAAMELLADRVVLAAGLEAQRTAHTIRGLPSETVPPTFYAKGHYYSLSGRAPFRHLVYPIAGQGGLGIHVTLDLAGQARFGPDVEWVDAIEYSFDDRRRSTFEASIRRYFPDLDSSRLVPGYTGIRPKLVPAGAPAADFVIHGPEDHGVKGLVALYGIESPGLTAVLAISEYVATLLA
jgi:L-2-hydroxyglutarate oxidase LhgO